jgi:spore coat protein CotH
VLTLRLSLHSIREITSVMFYIPPRTLAFLTCTLALMCLDQDASAQTPAAESDAFFKSSKILELNIELGANEFNSLRGDPRKYVKATLKENNTTTYTEVGVHLKGAAGSFRGIDDKPSITVNMDKFIGKQRFHGMDKFHLTNSLQDPSYLSELICGELFRAAGVPASRVCHAVMSINGKRKGLYYIKEGYDKYFLSRHFGTNEGNLYDGGFLRDIDQPLQLIRGTRDVKDRADLKALVAASREQEAGKRFQKLDKLLDLDQFITFLVIEVITWDWDGYPMKCNNYRIYHDPTRDKITFIPSGMDQMFGDVGGPLLPHFQGMVAQGLLSTPEGRKRYLARMEEILKKVYNAEALIKKLDKQQAIIQPVLASIDAGAGRDYMNQVNRLRQAIRQRPKNLEDQLKRVKR